MITPDWPAPPRVRALVSTRAEGDRGGAAMRDHLPSDPLWMRQVHGNRVLEKADFSRESPEGDASVGRASNAVCAVKVADCMPVLFADEQGTTVAAAHAGWRGLASGVLENTVAKMQVPPERLLAWMGPAISGRVYEVGEEVRDAFPGHEEAFAATRAGHWNLDLYAVARRRLEAAGVRRVYGGGFCTYTESERFFSWRRSRDSGRMAACIWLT